MTSSRILLMIGALFVLLCCAPQAYGQGACCLPDDTCMELTQGDCNAMGGFFNGNGSLCADLTCLGACCVFDPITRDMVCSQETPADCEAMGGSYRGDNIQCNEIICDVAGTTRLDGACILGDGTCESNMTLVECEEADGIWQGFGSKCPGDSIDDPYETFWAFPIDNGTGGCCFSDGSCQTLTRDDCDLAGGFFQGTNIECGEGNTCPVTDDDAISQEVQCQFFDFVMLAVDREFTFDKFDLLTGTSDERTLERVRIMVDGRVILVAVFDNRGNDAAVDTTDANFIVEQMRANFTDDDGVIDNVQAPGLDFSSGGLPGGPGDEFPDIWRDPIGLFGGFPVGSLVAPDQFFLICEECVGGFIQPGQFTAFRSPYFFPGFCIDSGCNNGDGDKTINANNTTEANEQWCFEAAPDAVDDGCITAPLADFVIEGDDDTFLTSLRGIGTLISAGVGKGDVLRDPHRAVGKITVIYEFRPTESACCLPDGSCIVTSEIECVQQSGTWFPGQACGETGACCLPDGSCLEISELCCTELGGSFQGEGTTCGGFGACCLPDGSCLEVAEICCINEFGGSFQGDGTVCGGTGACCLPDGSCLEAAEICCINEFGGSYQGDGTVCGGTGACCLPDGSCIEIAEICCINEFGGDYQGDGTVCGGTGACCLPGGSCTVTAEACCLAAGGSFQGDGTVCGGTGACCLPDGSCVEVAEICCVNEFGGSFQGDGTECGGTGACCLPDGSCVEVAEICCINEFGGSFQGEGTECGGTGACCLPDGSCVEVAEICCINEFGGSYQGDGTECGGTGACCLPDGSCVEVAEICCINEFGGSYQGDGTECGGTGACCLPDGSCVEVAEICCADLGGSYQGDGTECGGTGACCLPDGSCVEVAEICCINEFGGVYQGDGTECGGTGACCLPDGSCVEVAEICCINEFGGVYQGDGTVCGGTGACCLPDGSCVEVAEICCINEFGGTFQGDGTQCGGFGACCLPDGSCVEVAEICCEEEFGGTFQGDGTVCGGTGACCLPDGSCVEVAEICCINELGGSYQGDDTVCGGTGACCLPDGSCVEVAEICCINELGGSFQGDGTQCGGFGACCLPDGTCIEMAEICCEEEFNGVFQGDGVLCADAQCDVGPCCLPGGDCIEVTAEECDQINGGDFLGFGLTCDEVDCPTRCVRNEKGSLLIYPKIEIRWDDEGNLLQDTFIALTNDYGDDVYVQLYFVNGDPPIPADPATGERAHPGWNFVDNAFQLTGNQPTYWSAKSGQPAAGGLSPFAHVLDPPMGGLPGRPDPERPGERVMRGFLVLWATNNSNEQIRWNHLAGAATIVNYGQAYAWEYQADAFGVCDDLIPHGGKFGEPGVLNLDGLDYAAGYNQLQLNFNPPPSMALSSIAAGVSVLSDEDLTLMPLDMDFTMNSPGPVTTKAAFNVWNTNETKFSNTRRCITCWDQTLLRNYDLPNNFIVSVLQSPTAKARIDGVASTECNGSVNGLTGVVSQAAALTGISAKFLTLTGAGQDGDTYAAGGMSLVGMGIQPAVILYDPNNQPILENGGAPQTPQQMRRFLNQIDSGLGDEIFPPDQPHRPIK